MEQRRTGRLPTADRLLITADAGGSNGYRTRTWKTELAQFAAESGRAVTVCHLPPGTSKWNKIEHKLFSHISMNWRGRPLTSHEVIVASIAATTTRTGLTVHAELDTDHYPAGIQVTDEEIAALPITRHRFHGDWNYTLQAQLPRDAAPVISTTDPPPANEPHRPTPRALQDPELTGMTSQQLSDLISTLTPALEVQGEQALHTRRGHERLVAPGTGAKARLAPAEGILATVLHLRKLATMDLFGQLLGVTAMTISRAKQEVHPLLQAHGHHIDAPPASTHQPTSQHSSPRTPTRTRSRKHVDDLHALRGYFFPPPVIESRLIQFDKSMKKMFHKLTGKPHRMGEHIMTQPRRPDILSVRQFRTTI